MGFFDKLRDKKAAKQLGLSYDDYIEFQELKARYEFSIDMYKKKKEADIIGLSLPNFIVYWNKEMRFGSLDQYKLYLEYVNEHGAILSFPQYIEYSEKYSGYSIKQYKAITCAKEKGFNEDQCIDYAINYQDRYTIDRYIDFLD